MRRFISSSKTFLSTGPIPRDSSCLMNSSNFPVFNASFKFMRFIGKS